MKAEMTAQLVTDALNMAIWRRDKPDNLLHRSDRGSQYTSEQFQRLMADHGITCSMSRSGNVWDNAAMESFSRRSRPSVPPARSTGRGMTPRRMCSIIWGASTTLGEGTRRWAI
jgi:putative transposase